MKRTVQNDGADRTPKISLVRTRRAERTREEILRAGLRVFSEKGFRGATMDDIALELEATKGLLYYHFKTKDEILRAILAENQLTTGIEKVFEILTTMPLRDALTTAATGAIEVLNANRELVRFLHVQALLSGAEAEVVYSEVLARLQDGAARVIEHFKRNGEVRPDVDASAFALLMVNTVTAYFIRGELFGPHHQAGPGYLKQTIDTLHSGIAATPVARTKSE